jgi:hypothetical protein
VHLRVQLLGGPRPVDLESDSLAVGGLSVQLRFAPRVGDLLSLRLEPPPPDEPVDVVAQVVWYEPMRSRAGLNFHDVSDEARALLERLVFGELVRTT